MKIVAGEGKKKSENFGGPAEGGGGVGGSTHNTQHTHTHNTHTADTHKDWDIGPSRNFSDMCKLATLTNNIECEKRSKSVVCKSSTSSTLSDDASRLRHTDISSTYDVIWKTLSSVRSIGTRNDPSDESELAFKLGFGLLQNESDPDGGEGDDEAMGRSEEEGRKDFVEEERRQKCQI